MRGGQNPQAAGARIYESVYGEHIWLAVLKPL